MPLSIKGRFISEILEGMVYLTERQVIHKDIKPGNILVDKDFHIKVSRTEAHDTRVILTPRACAAMVTVSTLLRVF